MKLQYQLNIAFTALLIVILTATAFVIHSLLLNLLIKDEERQLEQKGELLVNVLNEEYQNAQDVEDFSSFLEEQDLQLLMYDRKNNNLLYSTMSTKIVEGFIQHDYFANDQESLWEYQSEKFVTSRILFYPPSSGVELILLTPLNDLEAVQENFIARLLVVFVIGAIVTFILSTILTNKLVTPLTRLKRELKKIERRQFDDVQRVKATGEIKEVEQSIYDMASELERYMKSQQTFFQNASHELKTPLMTIQGYAEGIKDHVFDEEDSEKGLEVMVTEVKRLKKIINEMILLAKLESDQSDYHKDTILITEIIHQVLDRTLPLVSEKNIKIEHELEEGVTLQVDGDKLLQALLNIIINGIRHADATIQITSWQDRNKVIIQIEDDGQGISADLLPHIFHRFVKGKNGETGLGLAIARAIVEQGDGKIAVTDSTLGGAKFTLTFRK